MAGTSPAMTGVGRWRSHRMAALAETSQRLDNASVTHGVVASERGAFGRRAGMSQPPDGNSVAGASMPESVKVFLSTVSDEFRAYREQLRKDLTRHNVEVKVQEDFKDLGGDTLDKLDVYIAHCDCVVHLVGDMTGSTPLKRDVDALLAEHSDLFAKLPPLGEAVRDGVGVSYTQWEAWLALYHRKLLVDRQGRRQS